MPYIIAVLALVVVGVGFTLYQSAPTTAVVETPKTNPAVAITETPAPYTASEDKEEEDDDTTKNDDGELAKEDDTDQPSSQPVTTPPVAVETPAPIPVTTPVPTPVTTPTPTSIASTNDFRNGTYLARTTYKTPDRDTYTMDVSVTVANDVITATDITFDSRALRDSYVKRFDSSYGSTVIGKDLGTVSLSRVAGASLTTNAFNNALASIKSQAGA
jgi:hypothetical protein